jgi:hypothetical protein
VLEEQHLGPLFSLQLIARQAVLYAQGRAAKATGQEDGVFHRLAAALAKCRRRGVCGIAQEREAPVTPPR